MIQKKIFTSILRVKLVAFFVKLCAFSAEMFTLSISNIAYATEEYLAKAVIPNLSHRYQPFSQTFDAKKANWSKNCDFRNPRNFHTSTQPYQKVKTLLRT